MSDPADNLANALRDLIRTVIADAIPDSQTPTGNGRLAYSPSEVAKAIGIGRTRVYELIERGAIPARKLGAHTLVLRADLERYLDHLPPHGNGGVLD
jgi:excisionase family DNA binding protein